MASAECSGLSSGSREGPLHSHGWGLGLTWCSWGQRTEQNPKSLVLKKAELLHLRGRATNTASLSRTVRRKGWWGRVRRGKGDYANERLAMNSLPRKGEPQVCRWLVRTGGEVFS